MTNDRLEELAGTLRTMYMEGHAHRESGAMVILFAVRHADELASVNLSDLVRRAGITDYTSHLSGGRALAKYVVERE